MLMALFMFAKWWKLTTEKTFGYIVNIYFKISKKLDKVYNDLKYSTYIFSNKFAVGIFYVLRLKLLKMVKKYILTKNNIFFFQNFDFNSLEFFSKQ